MVWLLPLPGDWHILYNYQKVLFKVIWRCWVATISEKSRSQSRDPLITCPSKSFQTNTLLLTSIRINRRLLKMYIQSLEGDPDKVSLVDAFRSSAGTLAHTLSSISSIEDVSIFSEKLEADFKTGDLKKFTAGYESFLQSMCQNQDTNRFWYEYLAKNCMAYIALHTAIRNGDWVLRMAAIKMMAAVFSAYTTGRFTSGLFLSTWLTFCAFLQLCFTI